MLQNRQDDQGVAVPARATHEPSPDGLGHSVGVPNAVEDFARCLESGGGDNSAFALNQAICCSGQDCGCRGSSVGQYLAHEFREFGKTVIARLEQTERERDVAEAAQLNLVRRAEHFRNSGIERAAREIEELSKRPSTQWGEIVKAIRALKEEERHE